MRTRTLRAFLLFLTLAVSGCAGPDTSPLPPVISTPVAWPSPTAAGPTSTPRPLGTPVIQSPSPTSGGAPLAPATSPARKVGTEMGSLAPDFTLQDLDGNEVSLSSLRGRPVLLNFWATWCPGCRIEFPDFAKAHHTYQEQGLAIVAVNFMENPDSVRKFVEAQGVPFLVLLDPKGQVLSAYRVRAIPSSFFLDREGVVVRRVVGAMSHEALDEYLAGLLR
ncbi:MAG: redoxin domain-containing protein [Anaerolineae bacterium]